MFELSQLRCFVAVAEELHFSRAAARLNMTQPPLSRQIGLLEHHVGARLLDRTSRSVALTAAGRVFLPEAARILRLADEAASTARRVAQGEQGALSIGFTATIGYGLMPELVRTLRAQLPGVSLTLKEMVSAAQLEALAAGTLDLGLLRPHGSHVALETTTLAREPLLLALPAREANRFAATATAQDLQGRRLLMYSPYEARYFHDLLQGVFTRARIQPEVVEYVGQIHTMLALVSSGIGWALIPKSAERLQFLGVALRPVTTVPVRPVATVASWRRDNDNPLLARLRSELLPQARRQALATPFG